MDSRHLAGVAFCILLTWRCAAQTPTSTIHASYAGDAACLSCHKDKAETFLGTAHHLTSRLAGSESIAGSFAPGKNVLTTANPELSYRMEARDGQYFQSAVMGTPPKTSTRTERMDLVIGSGRKGQTYLYWKGDQLFELPVSYWTELQQWVNSPGYQDGFADFDRPITPRCLECHATYFETTHPENHYKQTDFIVGISCEKCHGRGAEHVARAEAKNHQASGSGMMISLGKLPRHRQMDLCALCHGGLGKELAPAFSFVPGQALEQYLELPRPDPAARLDVHGNQVALLERSRCYQESGTMTCVTCHDVHQPQRDAAAFSQRCLSCHQAQSCGQFKTLGSKIAGRCVDCHMPLQTSNLIVSDANGRSVRPKVRNHWIKVYAGTKLEGTAN